MEIIKLLYRNKIWAHRDAYVEIKIIKKNENEFELNYFKYGNNRLNVCISGEKTKALKEKLKGLQDFILKEKDELYSFIEKDEKWELIIEFANGKHKEIERAKGYCDFEKSLLILYFWVKEHCENFIPSENSIINNMTDIDIWEIDTKFELLDQETISKMTGTGSNLK